MSENRRRWRGGRGGCGCGCASIFVVLTAGLLLSLFSADVGIGVSVRVPFTESNITIAGSVGKKDKAAEIGRASCREREKVGGGEGGVRRGGEEAGGDKWMRGVG